MARLIVLAGANLGESYELAQTNSLGSGDANAVIIPDPDVSEYHAQLSQIKKRFYIVNLTVSNTVEVNGREVEKIMLSNGDSIKLGSTMFLFSDEHEEKNDEEDELAESTEMKELDFGKYKIIEEISRGAHAVVYKAIQKGLDRIVALKVLLSGEHAGRDEINRFYTEAKSVATLTHPNIVPIFDIGVYNQRHYFAMEYIEGETLGSALEHKRISPLRGLKAIEQVARALEYAHKRSIVHRDIKPTNILIDVFGKALLSDFGIAKQLGGGGKSNTQTGQALGTPAYMAPEQAEGKIRVSPRADIYSLGAVLYEIFTGQKPYDASSAAAILMKVLTEDPIPPQKLNPKMNPDIATIITKAMERDPDRRYQTVKAMADDIYAFRRGQQIQAKPASKYYHLMQVIKKNAVAISAIVIALISTIASISYMTVTSKNAKRQIHKMEIEKEKVVFEAEKAAKQTKREETSLWHLADDASLNNFKNWSIATSKNQKISSINGILLGDKAQNINLVYKDSHNGNLQIDFEFKIPSKNPSLKISGFVGKTANNGLQFVYGKWQHFEMVIMHSGKILAMRKASLPKAGDVLHLSFKIKGLQAWLEIKNDTAPRELLTYRGLELLQVPYKRNAGLSIAHTDGELSNLKITYEDLPLKPTRLDIAHTYFYKGDLNDALADYIQISESPTYQGDPIAVEALYYAGLTLEAQRKYIKALPLFESILTEKGLGTSVSENQKKSTTLQYVFSLAQTGSIKKASTELATLAQKMPEGKIITPWEWVFIELFPKYYNTGHHKEALDILRSIKWSEKNILLAQQINQLANRIQLEKPKYIAELITLYQGDIMNPYVNKTLHLFNKKKNWEQLNALYKPIINNVFIPNKVVVKTLQQQFLEALRGNGNTWEKLGAYLYTREQNTDSPESLSKDVADAFFKRLKKGSLKECLSIYSMWPLDEFFPALVEYETHYQGEKPSFFRTVDPPDALLAVDVLIEASKWKDALDTCEHALSFSLPHNLSLLLRQATLLELMKYEDRDLSWESLAEQGNSFESKVAKLFTGEIDFEEIRSQFTNTALVYQIDFYGGLLYLQSENYEMAHLLLQRSIINNSKKQWPYRLCRRLLKSIPVTIDN